MICNLLVALAMVVLMTGPVVAAENVANAPPPDPYKKVSTLVKLPDFLPGIGTLYVDPKTLPDGPFLAYDHQGKLVSTIYMISLKDLNGHKTISDLAAPGGDVDHVSMYYNLEYLGGSGGCVDGATRHQAQAGLRAAFRH